MSQDQDQTRAAEDLEVEGSEAEAVTGGRASKFQRDQDVEVEMFRLESEGYVANACTTDGTVMRNPQTHKDITISGT